MAHPDQYTPDDHRSSTDQSPPKVSDRQAQEIAEDLDNDTLEADADTGGEVRTPEPTDERQGEAGNAYVGREMNDAMKVNPRIEDADRVTDEDDEAR